VPAVVVTFEPTPREFFEGPAAPSRLTRLREKLEALALYGVDRVVVLRFDRRMQGMSADEFVDRLLVRGLGVPTWWWGTISISPAAAKATSGRCVPRAQ